MKTETIPTKYRYKEKLRDAYERGYRHGSGFAAANVPPDGSQETHLELCWEAEDNSRQYSPFELICSEFNGADDDHTEQRAYFNRFEIDMPLRAALECSHSGECAADVQFWANRLERPKDCTPYNLKEELSEFGAWSDEELSDDDENWLRIVWLSACNISEEHVGTEALWEAFEAGLSDAIISEVSSYYDDHSTTP